MKTHFIQELKEASIEVYGNHNEVQTHLEPNYPFIFDHTGSSRVVAKRNGLGFDPLSDVPKIVYGKKKNIDYSMDRLKLLHGDDLVVFIIQELPKTDAKK